MIQFFIIQAENLRCYCLLSCTLLCIFMKRDDFLMNGTNICLRNKFILRAALLFILATIAFYILTKHRAHLLAYSSYIFFFAYILLHFFMCGRHGKHGGHGEQGGHCGHGDGKHKHGEAEKRIEQGTEGCEDEIQRDQVRKIT